MTVYELIQKLSGYPADKKVCVVTDFNFEVYAEDASHIEYDTDGNLSYVDFYMGEALTIEDVIEDDTYDDIVLKVRY